MNRESKQEKLLSIVIITKNEESNIKRCIESVFSAIITLDDVEVMLVDSASTDSTVDMAREYPVRILQLAPSSRLTPAAGRHIGFQETNGKYVFFLDGDSTVHKDWFTNALPYFDEDIRVAVLLGGRQELYMDPVRCSERKEVHPYEIKDKVRELIPFKILIGGSGLYRASVLRKVGGFNPYLYSNEESELCFRIHKAGYKILEIPHEMITHYTVHRENTKYLWKILSRRFHLGRGQVLRYGIRDGIISKTHFNGLGMVFSFTVCLLLGLLSIILSLSLQNIIFSLIWFSFCVALFFVWVTRIKSLRIPLYYMFYLSVQTYGLIHGFLMKPKDPNNYPIDVTVLQTYAEEKLV